MAGRKKNSARTAKKHNRRVDKNFWLDIRALASDKRKKIYFLKIENRSQIVLYFITLQDRKAWVWGGRKG